MSRQVWGETARNVGRQVQPNGGHPCGIKNK